MKKLKAFMAALSVSFLTMCTPAPAMAQAEKPETVWVYVTVESNDKGGTSTNLGVMYYMTEEICKIVGPNLVPPSKPETVAGCFELQNFNQYYFKNIKPNANQRRKDSV